MVEMEKIVLDFRARMAPMTRSLNQAKKQLVGFGDAMAMPIERMKEARKETGGWDKRMKGANTSMGRFGLGIRDATHGMRGFRMEMLGVMFFGMAIQRMMTGLVSKSLEWAGVFDVLAVALGILFLPVAMILLDWVLKFLDWVSSLSEAQKEWIGKIVLTVAAIGTLLMMIGTFALGIGSVILAFGKMFAIKGPLTILFKFIGGLFTGLSATVLVVVAVIVAIIVGMVVAWRENFMGMKAIVSTFMGGIRDIFSGIVNFFKGFILLVKGIFLGDWSMIMEGVENMFWSFVRVVWGIFKSLVSGIAAIFVGIVRVVWSIIKLIKGAFTGLPALIIKIFSSIAQKILNKFENILPKWLISLLKGGIKIGGKLSGLLGFAKGGIVPGPRGAPMPAIVHGGERIIPNGSSTENSGSPNITINASISSDYDVRRLAEELKRYWVSDFERVSQGRSV